MNQALRLALAVMGGEIQVDGKYFRITGQVPNGLEVTIQPKSRNA